MASTDVSWMRGAHPTLRDQCGVKHVHVHWRAETREVPRCRTEGDNERAQRGKKMRAFLMKSYTTYTSTVNHSTNLYVLSNRFLVLLSLHWIRNRCRFFRVCLIPNIQKSTANFRISNSQKRIQAWNQPYNHRSTPNTHSGEILLVSLWDANQALLQRKRDRGLDWGFLCQ